MKNRIIPVVVIYLLSFVCANLVVKHFGAYGLIFSSFFLIPFDFVSRCLLQEKWKGLKLIINLACLTIAAGLITYLINSKTKNIAIASVVGFAVAQTLSSIWYQYYKNKASSWFFKVNGSDLIAIVADSIIFQSIAFHTLIPQVTIGQVVIKFLGGLLWYLILFKKLRLQDRL